VSRSRHHFAAPLWVRLAGFSFERIERLRLRESVRAAEACAALEREIRAAAQELVGVLEAANAAPDSPSGEPLDKRRVRSRCIKPLAKMVDEPELRLPPSALDHLEVLLPHEKERADRLRSIFGEWQAAQRRAQSVFDAELLASRDELRRAYLDDARLREAVFIESKSAFTAIETLARESPGSRAKRERRLERLAIMYLQRFCAKNDTNSMCGPIGLAFTGEGSGAPRFVLEDEISRRRSFGTQWAGEALHQVMSDRVGTDATLRVRRNPSARLETEGAPSIFWCVIELDSSSWFKRRYARAEVSSAIAALFSALSEPRTSRWIFDLLATEHDLDEEEAAELLDELVSSGILMTEPRLPVGIFDPLAEVLGEAERWPAGPARDEAMRELLELREMVVGYGTADLYGRADIAARLDARFEALTGAASTRGAGLHYADRSLVYEYVQAKVRAELPAEWLDGLRRPVGALIDACSLPLELARENVRTWFRGRFGSGAVSVLEAHRAFDLDKPVGIPADTEAAKLLRDSVARVQALIGRALADRSAGVAAIDSAELEAIVSDAPGTRRAAHGSIDLMLAARPGKETPLCILGEAHSFFMIHTDDLISAPEKEREKALGALRSLLERLVPDAETVEPIFLHTQTTDRRFPIATKDLMVIGRSPRPGSLELGQLQLSLEGDTFRFRAGGTEVVPLTAYRPYPFFLYTSRFAPLVDELSDRFPPRSILPPELLDGDAPRLSIDDVVFRRATWIRPIERLLEVLGDRRDRALLDAGQRLTRELGGEQRVFSSVPGEPKPVLIDFQNLFLLEAWAHQLKRAAPGGRATLTEMLPAPEGLFFRGEDGLRTFELRMGVHREAD
jgi:hypothetical protein